MVKIIITGASSGLGLAIATKFLTEGYEVVNLGRSPSENCTNIEMDLTDSNQIDVAVQEIIKEHSDFEALILNSGIMPQADIGKVDFSIEKLFQTNILGSMHIVNKLDSLIKNNGSDIIAIGSTSAFKHFKGDVIYSASKFAVKGFIQSL